MYNYGTATLTNCTVSGNSATVSGGGLFNNGYYGDGHADQLHRQRQLRRHSGGGLFNGNDSYGAARPR